MTQNSMVRKYCATTPEATEAVGFAIGSEIESPLVITLSGPMGAGKTQFAKGLSRGLDCPELATSPTFALCNYYHGRQPVLHVDTYRLRSTSELPDLGLEDALANGAVLIVEWPDAIQCYLPPVDFAIVIASSISEPADRQIGVTAFSAPAIRILAKLSTSGLIESTDD